MAESIGKIARKKNLISLLHGKDVKIIYDNKTNKVESELALPFLFQKFNCLLHIRTKWLMLIVTIVSGRLD